MTIGSGHIVHNLRAADSQQPDLGYDNPGCCAQPTRRSRIVWAMTPAAPCKTASATISPLWHTTEPTDGHEAGQAV